MNKQPGTMEYTDSTADQIDRQMHKHPHKCNAGCTPKPTTSPGTVTFSLTPYNRIHVYVVDHGYPREDIIDISLLVRHVMRAAELGYKIIDHTSPTA